MFPLPALPLVPKLHRFFEPEQAKTFAAYRLLAATGELVDVLGLEMPEEANEAKRAPVPTDPRPSRR